MLGSKACSRYQSHTVEGEHPLGETLPSTKAKSFHAWELLLEKEGVRLMGEPCRTLERRSLWRHLELHLYILELVHDNRRLLGLRRLTSNSRLISLGLLAYTFFCKLCLFFIWRLE